MDGSKLIIKSSKVILDYIEVEYTWDNLYCEIIISIDSMIGFGCKTGHEFQQRKNTKLQDWVINEVGHVTDDKLMIKYLSHLFSKPRYEHNYIEELCPEADSAVLHLIYNTPGVMPSK